MATSKEFDLSAGLTEQKYMDNLQTLTGDGFIKGVFTYDGTADFAEVDEAEMTTVTATVPGVALGDAVVAVSLSVDIVDLQLDADVTAADTVVAVIRNVGASSVDLASATIRIVVWDLT